MIRTRILTFSADSQTLIYKTRAGEIVEWLRAANLVRSTAQHGELLPVERLLAGGDPGRGRQFGKHSG